MSESRPPYVTHPNQPWLYCQVCTDAKRLGNLSKDMIRAIRKLRRDLVSCNSCVIDPDICPIRINLDSQIDSSIQTIVDEWNLSDHGI